MGQEIKILLVEDNLDDVELLKYELKKQKLCFSLTVVDTEQSYRHELTVHPPDIVLSDYHLPQFDARGALTILKSSSPNIPFIIVSGMIGEDTAVEMIKAGCSDYLLKDKLGRLPTAILNALDQSNQFRNGQAALMALRESEERFRRIADNSPVLIWKTDEEHRTAYFNKVWTDFTGANPEELENGLWNGWIHPDDVGRIERVHRSRFEKQEKYETEYRLRNRDGMYHWVFEVGVPNYLEDGRFIGYLGSCIDINERKLMEEQVIKSQDMLNTFFSESLDGCFILIHEPAVSINEVTKNTANFDSFVSNLKIEKINSAFSNQLQLTGKLVRGITFSDFISTDEKKMKFFFLQLIEEGKTSYHLHLRRSDSKQMIAAGNLVALYDNENRITGCFGIQRDVTEEETEYQNLKQKADYYQRFFEDDLTGDFITRADGTIVMVNTTCSKIFGYQTPEEMYTLNVNDWYADPDERRAVVSELVREKKLEQKEVQMKKRDGTVFTALINAIGKFNAKGQLLEIIGFLNDNSHRKDVERQLLQSQKLESIGTLASGIAHDFNNILNNISGFSQQLQKYYNIPEKVKKYADTISLSADRGTQLAAKLLSFARQRKSESAVVSVVDVLHEVVEMCTDTFMKKIAIKVSVQSDLWTVKGDKSGLYQMLLNLSMNARDAILEKDPDFHAGVITITAVNCINQRSDLHWFSSKVPTRYVKISVTDNGSGIPYEIRDRIFDPFFTTKKSGNQKGTGLGLAIVYTSIKYHHGAIEIEGDPGTGTTFNVYLPSIDEEHTEVDNTQDKQYVAKNNELVFIVDDEEIMRELAVELLTEAGYRVITAKNGREAVEIFRMKNHEIDLVIMDLIMPELDGGQAYLEMKKIKSKFNIFFCSGFVTDDLIASVLSDENLKALQKPFKAQQLLKMVYDVMYSVTG
ncbi:MAG: PAS domain S-box protein [Bacteroidota bacterium]|jgi:PAS domain S-box-containing protein